MTADLVRWTIAAGPVLAIIVPLVAAVLVFALGRRAVPAVPIVAAGLTAVIVALMVAVAAERGAFYSVIGGWGLPLGIGLRLDAFAAVFLAMSAVVLPTIILFALPIYRHGAGEVGKSSSFWILLLFLWSGLNAVFLSHDLFNLYVALEIVSLAAVALVALGGSPEALRAQMRYLLYAASGSLLYLLGVALIYAELGVLDLAAVAGGMGPVPALQAAAVLMTLGLMIKGAIWPLHFWLPAAYATAPPAVSAALSGLVAKAPLYLLIRLWLELFSPVLPGAAWIMAGVLGGAAVLWGSLLAARQQRLTLMIAYSTVAQYGYIMLAFPLLHAGGVVAAQARAALVLHMISHGIAKAGMFLAVGALIRAQGSDRRDRLAGATRRAPLPLFALGLAALSVVALPPSGGFLAKWILLRAALMAEVWWIALVLLIGGLLAAVYVFRFIIPAFEPLPDDCHDHIVKTGWRGISALFLALLSVALGLAAQPLLEFLGGPPNAAEGASP